MLCAREKSSRASPFKRAGERFLQPLFLGTQKGRGLRPILDLRPINRVLCKRPFRMITLKQILAQIRPRDWFASVDLKDAYFHIQITPHHRRFLRFSFEGTAYQNSILPFGLALAPSTYSKCMDAALSPLRASGMRILNFQVKSSQVKLSFIVIPLHVWTYSGTRCRASQDHGVT